MSFTEEVAMSELKTLQGVFGRKTFHCVKGLMVLATIGFLLIVFRGPSAGADKLRMGYTSPSPTNGVLWVADFARIFTKNGLDVEVLYMPGNIAIGSMMAGEIQFAHMTGALMSPARLQGGDPLMLANFQDYLDDRLVVHSNIKSVEELKGKRIGVSRFGAASHMRVLNVLPRYGMSDRDIIFLQIGDTPARLTALLGNSIDATLATPPDHLQAVRMGMRILLNLREMNIPYLGTGLVTTQSFLARNRDVARKVVKAYVEAIHLVKTNPEASKRAFAKYRKTQDQKQLEEVYQTLLEMIKPKPYPSLDGLKTIFKDLSDRLPAAKTANPKDFIDVSLIEELDRSGFIDGLYR